jgi:carboxypeptidase C (cathepsin A)
MADDLYVLLTAVLAQFPSLQPLPFFVFGESYAGHYVPVREASFSRSFVLTRFTRPFLSAF